MKKKFLTFLLAICFMIPCVFMLTACGGGGDPDEEKDKNPEFTQFSTQVVAIMSSVDMIASEDNAETVVLSSKNSSPKNGAAIKLMSASMSTSEIETVFDMFKNHDDAEIVDDVNEQYSSCLETCFCFPLGIGDIITNKHGATSFYGVKARVELGSDFGYGSLVVENSGNTTDIYLFDPSVKGEGYLYITMTYNSKADYQIEYINYTQNLNNFIYAYGDSSQNFINLQKYTPENGAAQYGGYVSNGMSCYYINSVRGEQIQTYTENLISEKNPHQYDNKINETKTGAKYTISLAEVNEAYEKYVGKSNEEDEAYPIYVNKDGVARSVGVGDDFDCPTVVIPSKATALSEDLMLNPNCSKIVIPDSVTSIKISKNTAYWYENGKNLPENDPTREDYVDAPVEYVLQYFRISAGSDWDTAKPVELVFSENNKLFKTGEDGNVYLNYGGREILAYVKNFDADIVQTLSGLSGRAWNDFRQHSAREIPIFTYNAIEQLKYSNHKFKHIVFDGNSFYGDILTAENYTDTSEYVVDTVTCFGTFNVWDFYRVNGDGYAYQEELKIPNTQKVTRIKELIIKPETIIEYRHDLDPQVQVLGPVELKEYIDQNYPNLTYDEVLDNIIPRVLTENRMVELNVNRHIQIDKITIDPLVESVTFYGYYTANTVIDISSSTEVLYGNVLDMSCGISYAVDEVTSVVSLEYELQKFQGNVELCMPFTKEEFDLYRSIQSCYCKNLCDYIYALATTQSDRYSIKYADATVNMNFVGSDIEQYFDYSLGDPYYVGAYHEYTVYLTNSVESVDLSQYISCATNWAFEVYKDISVQAMPEWTALDTKVITKSDSGAKLKISATNSVTYESFDFFIYIIIAN